MSAEPATETSAAVQRGQRGQPGQRGQRDRVLDAVAAQHPDLTRLSETLHANPELGWQEHLAAGWTADYLAEHGFEVEKEYLGFPTAIRAAFGNGARRIGLMAEYDALPGLGHACGHNIITAISCGAAVALSEFAAERDLTVELYGTPAEEGGFPGAASGHDGASQPRRLRRGPALRRGPQPRGIPG